MSDPVTLRSDTLEATFLPALGMVCSSLRHEGEELLAQLGGPDAYAAHGSTFGIPLLYPWANRLAAWSYEAAGRHVELDRNSPVVHVDSASGLPIHGLLAASPYWRVTSQEHAALIAELDFGAHAELLAAFPFPHRLELTADVAAERLSMRLSVTATGFEAVPISFGFHPYLCCERRDARIDLPVRRRALLDGQGLPTGEREPIAPGELDGPLGERTFDDSFDRLAADPVFRVSGPRRAISIEFVSGWEAAQVYAPPDSDFICCEPMTAPVAALNSGRGLRSVEPGSEFAAEFAIAVT
jgi:galactose mutarotase-like enzyme